MNEEKEGPRTLGICVATKNNKAHVMGLAKAAARAGVVTRVFLTGDGVHLTRDPELSELLENTARVWVCEVSYNALGYKGKKVPGLTDKDFSIQMRNAELVEECDRYLIL